MIASVLSDMAGWAVFTLFLFTNAAIVRAIWKETRHV